MVSPMTRGAAAAFLQDLLARPTVPLGRGKKPNRLDVLLKHGLVLCFVCSREAFNLRYPHTMSA